MSKTIFSVVAISVLVTSCFAGNELAIAFKDGKVTGDIRAMYISDDFTSSAQAAGASNQSTFAVGGKLKYETAPLYGVNMGVSFFTTNKLSGENSSKSVANMYDGDSRGYSILGEAYLNGTFGKTTIKVGRQQLDTPLASSDDVRMIPNLFDAALIINEDIPDTTLIGGYVARMSGLDSLSGSYSKFKSMSDSAGVGAIAGSQGVYAIAAINKSIKDLTAQAWYYDAPEVLNAYYLQADYTIAGLTLSGQYYNIDDTGKTATALGGTDGANYSLYGVKVAHNIESIGLTPYIAYNAYSKKSNQATFVTGAWGGYPEFASMEEWTTNSYKPGLKTNNMSNAKLLKVGADYSLEKLGLGARTIGVAYGKYDYADANTDTNVFCLVYSCEGALIKNLAAKIAYEKVDAGSAVPEYDQSFFKVILNYTF